MLEVSLVRALQAVPYLAVRRDEPVARHADWRVGGPAELWLVPETEEALSAAAKLLAAARVRLQVLDGRRVLIRDGGIDGALVRPGRFAERLRDRVVGAWVPAAVLGRRAVTAGWRGLHTLMLRGGTVAEAWRDGVLEHVCRVRVLRGRSVTELRPEEVRAHHGLLAFTLDPPLALGTEVLARGRDTVARRVRTGRGLPGQLMQDSGRQPAAELITQADLCGVRLRGARIGTVEPNSIINLGGATARDILLLMKMVEDRVQIQSGWCLKPTLRPQGRNTR